MAKQLKIWNGRCYTASYKHLYIAAYSRKQAVELCQMLNLYITDSEIKNYFNEGAWGNAMQKVYFQPTEPCVFASDSNEKQIVQLYPITHRLFNDTNLKIHESGEANHYTILKGADNWLAQIQFNGELTVTQQREILQKFLNSIE